MEFVLKLKKQVIYSSNMLRNKNEKIKAKTKVQSIEIILDSKGITL